MFAMPLDKTPAMLENAQTQFAFPTIRQDQHALLMEIAQLETTALLKSVLLLLPPEVPAPLELLLPLKFLSVDSKEDVSIQSAFFLTQSLLELTLKSLSLQLEVNH